MTMGVVSLHKEPGLLHSGLEMPFGSTEVWGKIVGGNFVAHFWSETANEHVAACGYRGPLRLGNGQNALFGPGSCPKCKRCMNALRKGRKP